MTNAAPPLADRLGVCSWSLQADNPRELVECVQACGVSLVSLHLDPLRTDPAVWDDAPAMLQDAGIRIGSGMWGPIGEDYSTLETIRATGGVRTDETWNDNLENARADAHIAASLGVSLVTFHAGFLPHEADDPVRRTMIDRLRTVADVFRAEGLRVGFETGQEAADTLLDVLRDLDHDAIGVNFDPANMILYGMGDPIDSLRLLRPHLVQVHIKDALPAQTPGEWGAEVPVGTGNVDWSAFLGVLRDTDFAGDLMIEREAGDSRVADITTAAEFIRMKS
jgi:L-ribulose-5-phosphate 3-epimerase